MTSSFQASGATVIVAMDLEARPEESRLTIHAPRGTKVVVPDVHIEVSTPGETPTRILLRYEGVVEASGLLRPYSSLASSVSADREDYYYFRFTRPSTPPHGSLRLPEIVVDNTRTPSKVLRFQEKTHTWINCNA
ncbi:hypothetical protein [Variovorax paradoxus]|uniref:hypothetical protein n=1 Tax=Variovorax paradoxus TaxID=34073 RepID=UPI0027D838FC|nr:hypothetical protein [Variovorax paradoxus]